MKWLDVLPRTVAEHQAAWERRHAMLRACDSGARHSDIAKCVGLSRSRVHALVYKAVRERLTGKRSPVEVFLRNKDHPPPITSRLRAKLKAQEAAP